MLRDDSLDVATKLKLNVLLLRKSGVQDLSKAANWHLVSWTDKQEVLILKQGKIVYYTNLAI